MSRGGKRSGAGRKRIAPEIKALRGTTRKDREPVSDATPKGSMICPQHLGDLEQLYFGSIAMLLNEQGRASRHYGEIVSMLAIRLAQVERYKSVLECDGDTFATESVKTIGAGTKNEKHVVTRMIRKHPAVQMLDSAMRHAQSLLGELMLTPSSAQRIAEGAKKSANPFADF